MSINQDFMMDKDNLRNGQVQGGGVLAPEASAGHAEPEVERKWQWNRMVYAILLLQGIGMLFPWNVFITAVDYFTKRFCGLWMENSFLSFFGIAFNTFNACGLALSIRYQHKFSYKIRVQGPLRVLAVVFGLLTVLVLIPPSNLGGNTLFAITLPATMVSGLVIAILQGGLFGMAGMLPQMFTHAILGGQAVAGVTVNFLGTASLSSLLTIAAADSRDGDVCEAPYEDQKWSAFVYFLFSTIIILVCLASFPMLLRHPVVQFWIQRNSYEATVVPAHAGDDKQSLIKAGSPFEDSEADPYTNAQARLLDPIDTHLEPDQEAGDGGLGELEKADTTYIFKRVLPLAFAVCSVFTVTLAVFPSVTSKIKSTTNSDNRFFGDLWIPFSFLNFNVCDWLGRVASGWFKIIPPPPKNGNGIRVWALFIVALCRLAFIPLFLFCNAKDDEDADNLAPYWFKSDAWPIIIMVFFAFSNGYLGSLCMMYGPGRVEGKAMETAATIMIFSLTLGLCFGSFLSFSFLPVTGG